MHSRHRRTSPPTPGPALAAGLVIVAGLAGIAAPASAQIYKHVDAQGNITYTDKPPGTGKVDHVPVRPTSAEEQAAAAEKRRQFLAEQRVKADAEAIERDRRRTECNVLYAQRTQLSLPGPFSVPLDNGSVLVATGQAKADLKRHVESEIRQKCGLQ